MIDVLGKEKTQTPPPPPRGFAHFRSFPPLPFFPETHCPHPPLNTISPPFATLPTLLSILLLAHSFSSFFYQSLYLAFLASPLCVPSFLLYPSSFHVHIRPLPSTPFLIPLPCLSTPPHPVYPYCLTHFPDLLLLPIFPHNLTVFPLVPLFILHSISHTGKIAPGSAETFEPGMTVSLVSRQSWCGRSSQVISLA